MSVKHDYNVSMARGGANAVLVSFSQEQEGEVVRDMQVAASQTDVALAVAFPTLAKIQSIVIVGDQAFTLKTNSTATPQETLTGTAGVPAVLFDVRMAKPIITNIFAGPITNMFLTTGAIPLPLNFKLYATLDVP